MIAATDMAKESKRVRQIQLVAREAVFCELLEKYPWPTPNHKAVLELAYRECLKEMKDLGLEQVQPKDKNGTEGV